MMDVVIDQIIQALKSNKLSQRLDVTNTHVMVSQVTCCPLEHRGGSMAIALDI